MNETMTKVSLSEAKERFEDLIKRVESGEQVTITREGRPVVTMVSSTLIPAKRPLPARTEFRASQDLLQTNSTDLIRQLRDESY